LTHFLKSFWILYIDQIIVYNVFYSKLTFYIIKDRCQMHALKVFCLYLYNLNFALKAWIITISANKTLWSLLGSIMSLWNYFRKGTWIMLFQLKKLPEIINLTHFLKSFWILYIDQIIVYNAFYSKLTFYIIKDRCQNQ
jgi:hypothetical protein